MFSVSLLTDILHQTVTFSFCNFCTMKEWLNTHCQFTCIVFFALLSNRYPESDSHGFILQFLLSEAAAYAKAGKVETFILHLMKLDVPNLFAGPPHSISESFKNNLHGYIIANSLSRELQRHVEILMVSKHIVLAFKL